MRFGVRRMGRVKAKGGGKRWRREKEEWNEGGKKKRKREEKSSRHTITSRESLPLSEHGHF